MATAAAAAAAKEGVHGALFLRGFEFGAHFGVHCALLSACFYLFDKGRRTEGKKRGNNNDVLFSTSLGMPIKRAMDTRPMRIMGFMRMLKTETSSKSQQKLGSSAF